MWHKCAHYTYSSEAWDLFQLLVSQWPQNLHTCQSQDWTPTESTLLDWDINWPWHTLYTVITGLGRDEVKLSVQFLRWNGGGGGKQWSHSLHFVLNIIHRRKDHICSYIVHYRDIQSHMITISTIVKWTALAPDNLSCNILAAILSELLPLGEKLKGNWGEAARGPENRDRGSPHTLIFHVISSL